MHRNMTEQQDQKGKDKRREKKEQKKKRKRDGEEAATIAKETDVSQDSDDETTKTKSKESLKKRRLEREKLLELVPKVDENGISYTKQQIRLMRKRVQKGLHPIETPAEKHNRMVQEARTRKEVEAELAGFDQNDKDDIRDGDDDNKDENHDTQSDSQLLKTPKSHTDDNVADHTDQREADYSYEKRPSMGDPTQRPLMKTKRREKPVPPDYVCSACRGTNHTDHQQPPHWIYDCAYKKTMPGTNQVSRKKRGLHDPLETKLFVSGLPFDSTVQTVTELFTSHHREPPPPPQGTAATTNNNKEPVVVVHCKLIQFADTKRCKGQAFVTFATPAAAQHARTLNGTTTVIPSSSSRSTTASKNTAAAKTNVGTTKELKLKITKVLNRALTKK